MKNCLSFLLVLLVMPFGAFAQTEKGVSPVPSTVDRPSSAVTWAVVVGISNYQDPGIPDLRFADKDAEAFANFLRSPAGGSLDGDHLKVLLNENATAGNVSTALDWLVDECREGDQVIIYFSGHGDVEAKYRGQPGFLLCWDAPPRVYMAGGTVQLGLLQTIVSTLSLDTKARVTVIADACRSGKLAGSDNNGSQMTNANLSQQYANEIKILSCQPNEYSIEGEQWGGGRGAFSFNLVDALYGFADGNNDLFVTLQEVGRYLEDHVSAEVAPVSQVPMVQGSRTERLAAVDAKLLADLRSGRTSQMAMLSPVETRGMEDDVLAGVDTTVRELYRMFKQALKDKVFLEPADACADIYYERLIAEPKLARLHSTMRRNYAAALQDDAQQVLNTMLKTGLTEEVLSGFNAIRLYRHYPRYLQRAAELLGEHHYMFAALQARKYFFEGKIAVSNQEKQTAYRQALHWQPDMPHALVEMVNTFEATQADSALLYFVKTTAQVPAWIVPYAVLSNFYELKTKQMDKAEEMLNRTGQADSTSVLLWYRKARFYDARNNYEAAEYWYLKAISGAGTDICFPCAYLSLAKCYANIGRYVEAETAFKKVIQSDSTSAMGYNGIGGFYCDYLHRYADAEAAFKKALQLDSTLSSVHFNLGFVYYSTNHYVEAETAFKKSLQLDPGNIKAYIYMSQLYSNTQRYVEAETVLKRALQLDPNDANLYGILGTFYETTQRYDEADAVFRKIYKSDTTRNDIVRDFLSLSPDTHLLVTTHHGIYRGYGSDPADMTWEKVLDMDVNNGGNYGWDIFRKDSILLAGIDNVAGGRRGIYRSTDGGKSWTSTLRGTGLCFFDDGSAIYAGVDYQGIFKSSDLGKTWKSANNGIQLEKGISSPSAFVRAGNNLVASFYIGEIYLSSDHGENWSVVSKAREVSCMEKIGSVLFAGTLNGLMESNDNGLTWEYVKNNLSTQITALYATQGDTLYIGTKSEGMFISGDCGVTLEPLNNGVSNNRFVSCITQMNGKLLAGWNQVPGKEQGYFYNPASQGRMLWQYDGNNFQPVTANFRW